MPTKLLSAAEVAEILGISQPRVYEIAREGLCAGVVRIGRQVRFHPEKLDDWVEAGGTALGGGWRREPDAMSDADERGAQSCRITN
jgi:excisionase family DNA binding protein